MALPRHVSFLLIAFGFSLEFFLTALDAASCPATRINASEVCEEVGSNNVKISANLSYVVCDNLQNLSLVNRTFIVRALEFALRKRADVSLNVARVLVSQVNAEELEAALEEFNTKIVNSSLISPNWKEVILRALWDERLRNEDRFNETEFVTAWFQRRLRLFISGISTDMLQCLQNETMQCDQYQAIVKGLDAEFTKMSLPVQKAVLHSFQIPYLKGSDSDDSSLRCYSLNASFSVFLEERFQRFGDLLTLRDLETLIPTFELQEIVNTIPPHALADLFAKEGFLNDDPFLTVLLQAYEKSGLFMDSFNQKNMTSILPDGTKAALLAGVWPTVVSGGTNETEVDQWLGGRLADYFTFLNGAMLNASETLNASCVTFHKIVNKLNEDVAMFRGREEEMYYSIKAYLAANDAEPRCYNVSDPRTSGWLVMYFGSYIRYSSARDMRLLTNNSATVFQDLAFNRDNLELLHRYQVREDLAEMYADALLTVDSDFSLTSLPDQLLCFARRSTLIPELSPDEALSLIAQVNLHCNSSRPSSSNRQLATMLVAQVKTFDSQTLVALGQQAMGLTTDQISNLTTEVLRDPKVLESLGRVTSWNRGQSQMLVNEILRNNFTLDTAEKFESLGTLAQGLPSTSFDSISAGLAMELAKNANFVSALSQGPEHLRKAFVSKILSDSSSLSDILNNIPDELVDQVPNSLLVFRGEIPDLRKINEKQWSPQQAAVLFGEVFSRTDNYTELSAFILQGFQCNAASKLSPGQLSSLVHEVKIKNANLSEGQLSCMARLLARNNLTANITSYPPDVLLFFPLDEVDNANCEVFYTLASQGDLSLLANGSMQRTKLLENALSCFGVEDTSLSKEQLQQLGGFVCDMEAATIQDSDPGILENLKLCPDLTASQRVAFNALLSSGKTLYGAPETWNDGSLEDLGPLAFYINHTIWDPINRQERVIFFRNVADTFDSQSPAQKKKTMLFLKAIAPKPTSPPRSKRATEDCQSDPITASTLEDPLFIIQYDSAQQFDACLSNEVLKANLATLLEQPLPNDYLAVMKRKLDEIYPDGIPEDQLKLLGFLSHQYSAEEISKWKVTSSDTLAALLSPDNGVWEAAQLRQLVARYMESGGTLTSPLLDLLGGKYLCYLDEEQLKQINPDSIRHAEKLDISTCSQSKKDLLYGKAWTAFASQEGTSAYYPLIQPYLGGAHAEDLKKLARSQVDMDINTFIHLNPEELQKLSVQDVKGLLGVNLPDLKGAENDPSVALWIKRQFQSDLDTLGIGLRGGMTSLSSTAMNASIATSPSDAPTTGTPITTLATSILNATTSSRITWLIPGILTDATPLSEITTAAEELSSSVVPTTKTVPVIGAIPKVDFPTENATVSSIVTATSNETHSATPDLPTSGDVTDATTTGQPVADSNSTTMTAITMDSTDAFPSEITATSFNVTGTSNDTIGGAPISVTATYAETTAFDESRIDFNTTTANITALGPSTVDFTTEVPITITADSNDSLGGIPVLPPGTDLNGSTSVETTASSNTTAATNRTSPPPTIADANVTTDTNATLSPIPAMPSVTVTSSKRPPVPPGSMPNAITLASIGTTSKMKDNTTTASQTTTKAATTTRRASSKVPLKTRPPSHPVPNGYITVKPIFALASKASLSWVLLTLSLAIGISVQRRLL